MIRRQLITALIVIVVMTVVLGFVYPLVVTGIAQVAFHGKANDSLVKVNGKVVGSSLLGQSFTDKDGNALPQYFQSRPSAAGDGYDASVEQRLEPRAVEPEPHRQRPRREHHRQDNPYATPADPYCVPVQSTDKDDNPITDKAGNPVYDKNKDGTYVCNSNTVPRAGARVPGAERPRRRT